MTAGVSSDVTPSKTRAVTGTSVLIPVHISSLAVTYLSDGGQTQTSTHGVEEFPEELLRFFTQEQGRTLLVRGDPGAGKTLFALQALNVLQQHGGDCLYVSTRVDRDTIHRNYLVKNTRLTQSNVLDISQDPFDSTITPAEDLGTDRLDPESFLEWLQIVTDTSSTLNIVFDSWELVEQYLLSHARRDETIGPGTLVTRMATLARQHGLRIVLVTEQAEQTKLDYIVDGVVELQADHTIGGRPERTLLFEKLRGVRIGNRTRPFTLSEEQFQVFTPVSIPLPEPIRGDRRWEPTVNTKAKFSTGITDLDVMLDGGYNRGSVVHFELGPDLSRDAWSLPCFATARNFLSHGMGVAVVPLPESSPGLVRHNLEPILPDEAFETHCNVFETYDHKRMVGMTDESEPVSSGSATDETETDIGGFSYQEYLSCVESLREESDGPLLHIISMDATGDVFSEVMTDHATYVALHNDLSILVTKPGSGEQERADRIADVHFRLERRGETVFLYGENPVTPFLGFDTSTNDGTLNVNLTEMV